MSDTRPTYNAEYDAHQLERELAEARRVGDTYKAQALYRRLQGTENAVVLEEEAST